MPKILLVLLPLVCYGLWLLVQVLRKRVPTRMALNVHTSLLLMVYLLGTSGLGVFWVASQQLPVFDWHYLFGYCTLLLLILHLSFNLPMVLHWLRRPSQTRASKPLGLPWLKIVAAALALLAMYWLGSRHSTQLPAFDAASLRQLSSANEASVEGVANVLQYHEFSSESRSSVFRRAQGVEWGLAPPEFKAYADAVSIALPKANVQSVSLDSALRAPATRKQALRLEELGEILYLTAGITATRGGSHYRAAPSSGALFPAEVYLQVRRVQGLAAAWYHYDPQYHRLQLLKAPLLADGLDDAQAEPADVLVVVSAMFRRTAYKYRDRAFRYAAADIGHLLENLRVAGHAAAMQSTLLKRFDEARLEQTLALDRAEEGVLAVMSLRPASGWPAPKHTIFETVTVPTQHALGVTGIVQQATSLRLSSQHEVGDIRLPEASPATANLYSTITQRRSQRRFSEQAVPLASLSALLADMRQAAQLSTALDVHLLVNRVAGLSPGVYRYRSGHTLQLVRSGDFAQQAQAAALEQDVIGDAAVVLIISADKTRMFADGARGYRHSFLEAGLLGERWLLSAVARGLGACPVGAFYDDEAARLLSIDGKQNWVLHFAALGVISKTSP